MEHRIGFIGAGDIVRKSYLPVIARLTNCELVAICSRDGESARELGSLYQIQAVCSDYKELLLRSDIDTVFIATPPYLHRIILEAVMSVKKNLLVEKPLCTIYEDARSILQQARHYPKTFYAAFNNQFREENQWIKSKVLNGELGEIEFVDLEWFRTKRYEDKAWLYDARLSGGGVLMDLGVHLINFALSLIPNRRLFRAHCNNFGHRGENSVEDTSVGMIIVDRRVPILIKLGWDMKIPAKTQVVLKVFGREMSVSNQDGPSDGSDGYKNMIEDFFWHVENKAVPDFELVDDTMMLVDALYQSSHSHSTITGEFHKKEWI